MRRVCVFVATLVVCLFRAHHEMVTLVKYCRFCLPRLSRTWL